MSWDEIRKAVNSDLKVPLNEKAEYVYNIIPRGAIKKSYSRRQTSGSYSGTILDLQGKGALITASAYRDSKNSAFDAYATINIDNGKKIIKLIGETTTGGGTASLSVNLEALSCVGDVSDENILIQCGESISLNYPIYFEESIKVDVYLLCQNSSYPSGASIECLLF